MARLFFIAHSFRSTRHYKKHLNFIVFSDPQHGFAAMENANLAYLALIDYNDIAGYVFFLHFSAVSIT